MNGAAAAEWRNRWAKVIVNQRIHTLHMTQTELAKWLGTSTSTVGMWETGQHVPHDLMKIRVLRLMGLDPRELFRPLDADPIEKVNGND